MKMDIPSPVLHSLFALNQAGFEAYVVGGCVRDSLMEATPTDWDITTSALPKETLAVFQNHHTIETGIQHGTVTVMVEDMPLEITTFRVDGAYSDSRRPDTVTFTPSLTEDLKRRDFTINAIAYHPTIGIVDPFDGQGDLINNRLRCVGNPEQRFTEDALRILRALRFSATKGFSIDSETATAIHRLAHNLSYVSAERISIEMIKLLCGNNVATILCDYADVLSVVLPDVDFSKSSSLVSSVQSVPTIRLAALMFDLTSEMAEQSCKQLKLSTRMTNDVTTLVEHRHITIAVTRSAILRALNKLGPELLDTLLKIRSVADQCDYDEFRALWSLLESNNKLCYRTADLAVNGADLIALGIPPGPAVGIALNRLLEAVMDGVCANTREELLNYAIKKPVH